MSIYTETDILVDPSGDLVVAPNGDFQIAWPSGVLLQDVVFRAKTDWNDFEPHQKLGANLQSLIGEMNTKETGMMAEKKLFKSLTAGSRVESSDLKIKAVPISRESIALYTFINATNYDSTIFNAFILDYEKGIVETQTGE